MSESSSDEYEELSCWGETWKQIKENDSCVNILDPDGVNDFQNMTNEEFEELGKDIANNTHLVDVNLSDEALNDHKMSFLFRGLTRSSSIKEMFLDNTGFGVAGVRSMVPFLQNTKNLTHLYLSGNTIQSEGFNMLFRALNDNPIEELKCCYCGIESIEMDNNHIPKLLKTLQLSDNKISTDGCRGLAKLLQGRDATLETLCLQNNEIDDDGVEILVGALINNTSLKDLDLKGNHDISKRGMIMLLKLVNDISSIEATLRSNKHLHVPPVLLADAFIQNHIILAMRINRNRHSPEAAGRAKVIQTQLHSKLRAELAEIQGVNHSLYSEINPLHLPEVLALVHRNHGQGELFIALKSSIAELISTVNEKQSIQQQIAYHTARLKELGNRLAVIEAAEESTVSVESESRSIKRRRAC